MDTKYGQIAHELRQSILSGEFRPGDTLPAIPQLMATYHVARDTVRDAISVLTHEGLVTPLRGVGTVVREITPVDLGYLPNAPSRTWAQQAGEGARDQVVSSGWELADQEIAFRLSVEAGDQVIHRVRHQSRGKGVAQIHEQWVPETVAKAIQRETGTDLADAATELPTDIFSLMRQAKHAPTETTEKISARMPDPSERETMEMAPGVPVLVTHRTTQGAHDRPVETSTMVGDASRMSQSFTVPLP